jgi:hypothetical protein
MNTPSGESPVTDPRETAQTPAEGLSDAELDDEMAVELPDREAMSIVGLPVGPIGGPVDALDPDAFPTEDPGLSAPPVSRI